MYWKNIFERQINQSQNVLLPNDYNHEFEYSLNKVTFLDRKQLFVTTLRKEFNSNHLFAVSINAHPPPPTSSHEQVFFSRLIFLEKNTPSHLLIFGFLSLAPKKFEGWNILSTMVLWLLQKSYWEISNGKDSLYAYAHLPPLVETDPFMVQFLEPNTSRSVAYQLNDVKFRVLPEDFVWNLKDPQLVAVESIWFLIKKIFHQTMIFFNEVSFTSYCCVRYFHKTKK